MVQQVSQFRSPHAVLLLFTSPLLLSAPRPAHHLLSITLAQWKIARFSTAPGLIHFCLSPRLWGDFLLCRDRVGSYDPASDSLVNRVCQTGFSVEVVWIFRLLDTGPRHFPVDVRVPTCMPIVVQLVASMGSRLFCSCPGEGSLLPLHPGLYSPGSPHLGPLKNHPPAFSELPHVNQSSMQQGSHLPARTRCG